MSFGVFSSKFGASPQASLDFAYIEPTGMPNSNPDSGSTVSNPPTGGIADIMNPPPNETPLQTTSSLIPNLQDIPWSIVIPVAVIGTIAAGVAWYLGNEKKLPEIAV